MQHVPTKPAVCLYCTLYTDDFADAKFVRSPDADLARDFETAKPISQRENEENIPD